MNRKRWLLGSLLILALLFCFTIPGLASPMQLFTLPIGNADQAAKVNEETDKLIETSLLKKEEDTGAFVKTVEGKVLRVNFTELEDGKGKIMIETQENKRFLYSILPELVIRDQHGSIPAKALNVGALVSLKIQDVLVMEGYVLGQLQEQVVAEPVDEFELDIQLNNKDKLKLEYKREKGKAKAEVEKKIGKNKEKMKGKEAALAVERLLAKLALHPELGKKELLSRFLDHAQLEKSQIKKLKMEIKFSNGKEIEIEYRNDDEVKKSVS